MAETGHEPDLHHDADLRDPHDVTIGHLQAVVEFVLSGRRVMPELRREIHATKISVLFSSAVSHKWKKRHHEEH